MPLIAKEEGGVPLPLIPAGLTQGVCYAIYDLGTQHDENYDKDVRKVVIIWELPEHRIEIEKDGEKKNLPRVVSMSYTLSLAEKANLRKMLQIWRGKPFTKEELAGFKLEKLLGINCMIQIIHENKNGKDYANVSAIISLMKNYAVLAPENPTICTSLDDHLEIPKDAPKWIRDRIAKCKELAGSTSKTEESDMPPDAPPQEDCPF